MNTTILRFVPVALLGLGVLLISGIREQYALAPSQPVSSIPATLNGLSSRNIVIAEEERRVAGMTDYVLREHFRDSAMLFSVYVGYYDRQVQGKAIHSPKNCLPGAGWEVVSSERLAAPGVAGAGSTVNRVLLANRGVRALVYYWYQGRGRVEASEYAVKWNLLKDAASLGRTEESLVRIVIPMPPRVGTSQDAAFASADSVADAVARELIPSVSRVMPTRQARPRI